jgi:hypothetical protein
MDAAGESRERIEQWREKAEELQAAAGRTSDPADRERLQEEARRLQSQSDQESLFRAGDIYPAE